MSTRAEQKRDYKQNPPPMGVFLVHNTKDHRYVLGSSQNLPGSLNRYRFMLEQGRPGDPFLKFPALLMDYKALGAEAFEFTVLDTLKPKDEPGWDPVPDLAELEALWQKELQARGWEPY